MKIIIFHRNKYKKSKEIYQNKLIQQPTFILSWKTIKIRMSFQNINIILLFIDKLNAHILIKYNHLHIPLLTLTKFLQNYSLYQFKITIK